MFPERELLFQCSLFSAFSVVMNGHSTCQFVPPSFDDSQLHSSSLREMYFPNHALKDVRAILEHPPHAKESFSRLCIRPQSRDNHPCCPPRSASIFPHASQRSRRSSRASASPRRR